MIIRRSPLAEKYLITAILTLPGPNADRGPFRQ